MKYGRNKLIKEKLKKEILELLDEIDDIEILYKILTVVRTHLEILKKKGRE